MTLLDPQNDFPGVIARDLFGLVAGDEIGYGISRRVYVYGPSPNMVIKFEAGSKSFQNVMEWQAWDDIQDTPYKKWFAPCYMISPCGTVLIQKRTEKMGKKQYPAKMPTFFTDFKYNNYGLYKNRIVCHDYGYNRLMDKGLSKRMIKADWWGDL